MQPGPDSVPDEAERLVRDNIRWMLALAQRILSDRALAEDAPEDLIQAIIIARSRL